MKFAAVLFPETKDHGRIVSTRLTDTDEDLMKYFPRVSSSSSVITSTEFKKHLGIVTLAYMLLTAAGFQVYPDEGVVEFHEYTGERNRRTPLGIHCDDYGAMRYAVETCIFYLEKDPRLAGGNLLVWDQRPSWFSSCCFSVPDEPHEIRIETGLVLLMSGDVYHRPQDVDGVGTRRSVVVQLRSRIER